MRYIHAMERCCCWVTSVVSDSLRPQRRQPTRLPRPWDSPGKNTGVGCHFLLQCMKVKSESEVAQSSPTLSDPTDPTRLLHPWDFTGKSTRVGCHCLFHSGIWYSTNNCISTCSLMSFIKDARSHNHHYQLWYHSFSFFFLTFILFNSLLFCLLGI